METKGINPVQSFLMGQFDKDELKSKVPFMLFSKDGGVYRSVIIMQGFEKTRYNKDGILLETVFMVNGGLSADCYWIAEGEKPRLEIPTGALEVDFIEIGNQFG